METKKIYQIIMNPEPGELPYKVWEVAEDFPVTLGYTTLDPTGYRYPLWDGNQWIEDLSKVVNWLVEENRALKKRVSILEGNIE